MRIAPRRAPADRVGRRVASRERYWDLELEPDESVSEDEWVEAVARGVRVDAVARQLVSDVPVGSYLSGGMDSASIVAVAARRIPRLMTFTGGFDLSSVNGLELVFDERADAERVASTFRTEHYEMVMHAGDMAWVLPELVWHLEDLRVGMSYQNHYIARLASKFVKVSLAGTGGDELFAGYPWRYDLVDGLDDPSEFDRRYYDYWCRLVPDDRARPLLHARAYCAAATAHPPFDVYRERARAAPTVARPGREGALLRGEDVPARACSSSRTASRWRTASRCACRSSTTSSSTSRGGSRRT